MRYSYLEGIGCGGSRYNYVSPDFFRLVAWQGPGYKPVGYGYDSIAANFQAMRRIETKVAELDDKSSLKRRREIIHEVDAAGIIATPADSYINELVIEAARLSQATRSHGAYSATAFSQSVRNAILTFPVPLGHFGGSPLNRT